jgi:hypothetical protein
MQLKFIPHTEIQYSGDPDFGPKDIVLTAAYQLAISQNPMLDGFQPSEGISLPVSNGDNNEVNIRRMGGILNWRRPTPSTSSYFKFEGLVIDESRTLFLPAFAQALKGSVQKLWAVPQVVFPSNGQLMSAEVLDALKAELLGYNPQSGTEPKVTPLTLSNDVNLFTQGDLRYVFNQFYLMRNFVHGLDATRTRWFGGSM